MSESTATVAPLLSAALAALRNLVLQDVVVIVNAVYATIVAAVMIANLNPYWYVFLSVSKGAMQSKERSSQEFRKRARSRALLE